MGQYQGVFESFNPRARDGREVDVADHGKGLAVSIHAPVMDANPFDGDLLGIHGFQSTRP